jgi:hypothetical protein
MSQQQVTKIHENTTKESKVNVDNQISVAAKPTRHGHSPQYFVFWLVSSNLFSRRLEMTRPINKKQITLCVAEDSIHILAKGTDENLLLLTLAPETWTFVDAPKQQVRITFQYHEMYELLRSLTKDKTKKSLALTSKLKIKKQTPYKTTKQELPFWIKYDPDEGTLICAVLPPNQPVKRKCIFVHNEDTLPLNLSLYGEMENAYATIRVPWRWLRNQIMKCGAAGSTVQLILTKDYFTLLSRKTYRVWCRLVAHHNALSTTTDSCLISMLQGQQWMASVSIINMERFLRRCSQNDFVVLVVTPTPYLFMHVVSSNKGALEYSSEYHMKMTQPWQHLVCEEIKNKEMKTTTFIPKSLELHTET